MKKRMSVLLSLLFTVLLTVPSFASALGDVDVDGGVTAGDARIALRIAVGLEDVVFGTPRFLAADVTKDGAVTAEDARLILRVAVGLETLTTDDSVSPDGVLTLKQINNRAIQFTVEITSVRDDGVVQGSGFFISEDGKLLTSYEVIENTNALSIKDYNGNTYEVAQILGFDRDINMALLQVHGGVPAWAALNTTNYNTADMVYAEHLNGFINSGTISKLETASDVVFIKHTAVLSEGDSGSPLLDDRGSVIGINTGRNDMSLYYAAPVSYLDKLDLSSPMSVEAFSEAERNFKSICFLEDYSTSVVMHPNAVGIFPFDAYARTAFTITVKCDSDALDVNIYPVNQFVNGLYIVAKKECENVPVILSMKEYPDISVTLNVTVSAAAPAFGGGILRDIPDFGAICGIAPVKNGARATRARSFSHTVPEAATL